MLDKAKHIRKRISLKHITMPKIPKAFIDNYPVSQILYLTINEFNSEEQAVIYLYCMIKLPISEITDLTELSHLHIISTLLLYSEKLAFKLGIFEKAVPHNINEFVSVGEMFELESRHSLGLV